MTDYFRLMTGRGGYVWIQTVASVICNSKNIDEMNIVAINYVIRYQHSPYIISTTDCHLLRRSVHLSVHRSIRCLFYLIVCLLVFRSLLCISIFLAKILWSFLWFNLSQREIKRFSVYRSFFFISINQSYLSSFIYSSFNIHFLPSVYFVSLFRNFLLHLPPFLPCSFRFFLLSVLSSILHSLIPPVLSEFFTFFFPFFLSISHLFVRSFINQTDQSFNRSTDLSSEGTEIRK